MYCRKCGAAIPDDAAFCPACGATQSNSGTSAGASGGAPIQPPAGTPTQKKKQNIYTVIGKVLLVLAALAMFGGLGGAAIILLLLLAVILTFVGYMKEKKEE